MQAHLIFTFLSVTFLSFYFHFLAKSLEHCSKLNQNSSLFFCQIYIYEHFNFQITILVAAEGVHKLPAINGSGDLKEALQKLASIPASRTLVRIKIVPN